MFDCALIVCLRNTDPIVIVFIIHFWFPYTVKSFYHSFWKTTNTHISFDRTLLLKKSLAIGIGQAHLIQSTQSLFVPLAFTSIQHDTSYLFFSCLNWFILLFFAYHLPTKSQRLSQKMNYTINGSIDHVPQLTICLDFFLSRFPCVIRCFLISFRYHFI